MDRKTRSDQAPVHCNQDLKMDDDKTRPVAAAAGKPTNDEKNGPPEDECIMVTHDPKFNATHIKLRRHANITKFLSIVAEAEQNNTKGAIHLWYSFWDASDVFVPVIKIHLPDYQLRQTITKDDGILYCEHYKWNCVSVPDKVPCPATSIAGVTVLIVDIHGSVLWVQERGRFAGKFKFPSGALEKGETFVDAALREVKEELGVDVDLQDTFILGGYMQGKAREGDINDVFMCLVGRIPMAHADIALELDSHELKHVQWIDQEQSIDMSQRIDQFDGQYLKNCLKYLKQYYATNRTAPCSSTTTNSASSASSSSTTSSPTVASAASSGSAAAVVKGRLPLIQSKAGTKNARGIVVGAKYEF